MKDGRLKETNLDMIRYNLINVRDKNTTCVKMQGPGRPALHYWNISCAFDIETTNTRIDDVKTAWMYEWTFGIDDYIVIGSTWTELKELFNLLSEIYKEATLVIYVHNLAFEMSFLKSEFDWNDIFEVEPRTPLRCVMSNGLEFRCSSLLSGSNLETLAKNLQFHTTKKLVGDLDYSLIRTSDTILSLNEYNYCLNDVQILLDYIEEQIQIYKDIAHIPYTNTGRVRNYCRSNCLFASNKEGKKVNNRDYLDLMSRLQLTQEEYDLMHGIGDLHNHGAFAGGYTHASPLYNGEILEDVDSYDLTSAYPTVMISERFPMTKGYKLPENSYNMFNRLVNHPNKLLVFILHLENVKSKIDYDYYISRSKCNKIVNPKVYNGRVVSADYLEIAITSVDYHIIRKCYNWDREGVSNVWCYGAGYLPTEFVKSILKLYEDKTKLKGVKGREVDYQLSKSMLNASYGMTVQAIEDLKAYNKRRNRFLYYPWGVFVTAYNRARVWEAIFELKEDYVYTDTDSVKCLNGDKHIDWFKHSNDLIKEKLYKAMDYHNLPYDLIEPSTIKGDKKLLGAWDYEGRYDRFKTLGAKRYLTEKEGKFALTNAGIPKSTVKYLGDEPFKAYRMGLYIPPEYSGKLCHTYIDVPREYDIIDYQGHTTHIKELSSCHLEPVAYELSDDIDLADMIDYIRGLRYDI